MEKKNYIRIFILALLSCLLTFSTSCKKNSVNTSKKEYQAHKKEGFWFFRTQKAINYNQNVVKPKRDKHFRKIARENKSIEKYNTKSKKKFVNNAEFLKTFDHH